jgi:uncharacterized repeat protein (TIGR01451 family)
MNAQRKLLNAAVAAMLGVFTLSALTGPASAVLKLNPDIACISKTASPGIVNEGVSTNITYEVTVENVGAATANDVTITDALPGDVSFVSAAGCTHSLGTVTCDIGSLAAGADATRTIVVNAPDPAPGDDLTNVASVSASNDASAGNNGGPGTACEVTVEVRERPPETDIECVVKTADPETLTEGQSEDITYEVTFRNNGPDTAANVFVIDTLPSGLTPIAVPGNCSFNVVTEELTCDFGTVNAGVTDTLTFQVNVPDPQVTDEIVNVAEVGTSTPDVDVVNNTCAVEVEVIEKPCPPKKKHHWWWWWRWF